MPVSILRLAQAVFLSISVFFVHAFVFCVSSSFAQLPEDRSNQAYIKLLEEQQLFNVIAWDSRAKFENLQLSEARRSTAAAQWLRAEMLLALNQPQEQQESAWAEVESLSQTLVAETRLFPRHFLVRFQASVTGLARARLIRLQLKSSPDAELRQKGREAVRTSIMQLGLLQRELVDAAAGADPKAVDDLDVEFSRPQFQALGNDVDFQVLACLDVQSSLYPADDQASRIDGWRRILEQAATLQPKLPDDSKLWWQTQTIVLRAARQLKDWPEWKARWETAILRYAPPEVLGDIAAAQLLHDLDREGINHPARVDQALKNANNFVGLIKLRMPEGLNGIDGLIDLSKATAWPSFDIARARLFLEQAKMVSETSMTQQAEAAVLKFAGVMAQRHGRFWAAELTSELLSGGGTDTAGGSVSLLLVRQRINEKKWAEVQQLIETGIQSAVRSRQADQALDLANMAAGVARVNGPQAWIVESIEAAALAFKDNVKAEPVHFFACVLANLIPADKYSQRQQVWLNHLEQWPVSGNSDRIRVQLLAPFYIQENQLEAAAEVVDGVPLDSPYALDAVAMLTAIFGDRVQQLSLEDPALVHPFAMKWSQHWKLVLQKQNDWLNRWTPAQKSLALLWVQAETEVGNPDYVDADQLLRRIKERPPELTKETLSRWQVMQAKVSFQKNPATFSPANAAAGLENCTSNDLVWLAAAIGRRIPRPDLAAGQSVNRQGQVYQTAQFYLLISEALSDDELSAASEFQLQIKKVEVLIHLSQFQEAKALAKKLSGTVSNGNSLLIQQLLGYALSGSNDPADADLAIQHWRRLTQKTTPGSDAWFEAKYFVALALKQKGQAEEAHRLLAYLKLTQPDGWKTNSFSKPLARLMQSVE